MLFLWLLFQLLQVFGLNCWLFFFAKSNESLNLRNESIDSFIVLPGAVALGGGGKTRSISAQVAMSYSAKPSYQNMVWLAVTTIPI